MRSLTRKEAEQFESYLRGSGQELIGAMSNPAAFQPLLDAVANFEVRRMLDVGCGLGQMLYPFVALKDAVGIGVDPADQACRFGTDFYATHLPSARVRFICAEAEALPFESGSFDLVNCGLALPYMHNARALDEIRRVLRPGGVLLLKIHHALYYLRDLWYGLTSRELLKMVHASRVLAAGGIYHLTAHQTETRLLGKETFQTRWLLQRELDRRGLKIKAERSDTSIWTPAYVISKAND